MNNELLKRIISSLLILPIVIFIIVKGSYYFILFLIICLIISLYEWLKMSITKFHLYLGTLFLFLSFYSVYLIRFSFNDNYLYLLFILIICIGTDLGGFLFGKIFKGPKLSKISPNKTYSGMIGSFILPIILINLLSAYISFNKIFDFNNKVIIFIIMVSLISQLGDLVISYFKRTSNLKDTGNIIPGHGGILDRIDGMIFAFPFSYLFILLTKNNIL